MNPKAPAAPSAADLIWLCRRLASALQAGQNILSALDSVAQDAPSDLGAPLRAIRQTVRAAGSVSDGLTKLQWPCFVSGMVRSGESRNALEEVLLLLADQLEAERATPTPGDPNLRAYAIALARLGVMLGVGVPLLTALESAADTDPRSRSRDVLLAACAPLRCGADLAETLASLAPDLPEMTIDMIRDAEREGRLAQALPVIADYLLDTAGEAKPRRKKLEV